MGVKKYEFMHSTPNELKSYDKAYLLKREMQDEQMWMFGHYMMSAVYVAVAKCLRGNKSDVKYVEKPIFYSLNQNKLSQEEQDDLEIQKMIMYEEQWARQARKNGLPETKIK